MGTASTNAEHQTRELYKHAANDASRRRIYCNLANFYLNVLEASFFALLTSKFSLPLCARCLFARLYDASVPYDVVQRALPGWSYKRLSRLSLVSLA